MLGSVGSESLSNDRTLGYCCDVSWPGGWSPGWPAGLQTALPSPDHQAPLGIISDQMFQLSCKVLRSPGCHAMLVRWGWPLPFLRQFISLYDVIWYQKQALYCPLLCRAVRCRGCWCEVCCCWCCDLWRDGMWRQAQTETRTGSGLDKNPRIQNLELSTSTGALRAWTSLSSSFSSLSLFSSSLTLKLNEVSEKKTILNAESRCRHYPTFAQSEVIKRVADVKLRILLEAVPPETRVCQLVVSGIDALEVPADHLLLLLGSIVLFVFFCRLNWQSCWLSLLVLLSL